EHFALLHREADVAQRRGAAGVGFRNIVETQQGHAGAGRSVLAGRVALDQGAQAGLDAAQQRGLGLGGRLGRLGRGLGVGLLAGRLLARRVAARRAGTGLGAFFADRTTATTATALAGRRI